MMILTEKNVSESLKKLKKQLVLAAAGTRKTCAHTFTAKHKQINKTNKQPCFNKF